MYNIIIQKENNMTDLEKEFVASFKALLVRYNSTLNFEHGVYIILNTLETPDDIIYVSMNEIFEEIGNKVIG